MIITNFLVPKKDVVYLTESYTMRQAMEKMEVHRYSAVPIIGNDGRYIKTLTEGDLLWEVEKHSRDYI